MFAPLRAVIGSSFRFAPSIEKSYQEDLAREKVSVFIRTNILCAALYTAFAWLDMFCITAELRTVWLLRGFVVVGNLAASLFAAWRTPTFLRYYTTITSLLYLGWALGIECIMGLATPTDLARTVYYAGLILVSMALYTWTYLRPILAMAVGLSIAASYGVLAWQVQGMVTDRHELVVLLANNYFLVSANAIGLFSLHTRERFARQAFLLKDALRGDIEKGEQTIREKEHIAEHDPLTGLLNRAGFQRRLKGLLRAGASNSAVLGVIFIDLDGFKAINDTFGHAAGDVVLQAVAQRIRGALRASDLVGRPGGDEFVIALTLDHPPERALERICAMLDDGIKRAICFEKRPLLVQASIGMATSLEHGFDVATLMHAADQRMYEHKRKGARTA